MKKINVFFNPGVHPQFAEIFKYPPKNVKYHYSIPKGDHNAALTRRKRYLYVQLNKFGIPRLTLIPDSGKYDLIHSTRGILPLNNKRWVTDIESGAAFSGLNWNNLRNPVMQKIIIKISVKITEKL